MLPDFWHKHYEIAWSKHMHWGYFEQIWQFADLIGPAPGNAETEKHEVTTGVTVDAITAADPLVASDQGLYEIFCRETHTLYRFYELAFHNRRYSLVIRMLHHTYPDGVEDHTLAELIANEDLARELVARDDLDCDVRIALFTLHPDVVANARLHARLGKERQDSALLRCGVNPNSGRANESALSHWSSLKEGPRVPKQKQVQELLSFGASVNETDGWGRCSPLAIALRHSNYSTQLVGILLSAGADPNAPMLLHGEKIGAEHLRPANSKHPIYKRLFEFGADPGKQSLTAIATFHSPFPMRQPQFTNLDWPGDRIAALCQALQTPDVKLCPDDSLALLQRALGEHATQKGLPSLTAWQAYQELRALIYYFPWGDAKKIVSVPAFLIEFAETLLPLVANESHRTFIANTLVETKSTLADEEDGEAKAGPKTLANFRSKGGVTHLSLSLFTNLPTTVQTAVGTWDEPRLHRLHTALATATNPSANILAMAIGATDDAVEEEKSPATAGDFQGELRDFVLNFSWSGIPTWVRDPEALLAFASATIATLCETKVLDRETAATAMDRINSAYNSLQPAGLQASPSGR